VGNVRTEAIGMYPASEGTVAEPLVGELAEPTGGAQGFGSVADALDQVNQLQFDSDRAVEDLAVGRTDSIHEAVIALEKANMALQFTIQITRKAVEAYQEIMRMQV
jgi:flagellar hook-basal body complex protein FliE